MNFNRIVIFYFIFLVCATHYVTAQVAEVSGQNICGDGSQRTTISITGMDQTRYYGLYHDDKLLQLRKSEPVGGERNLTFGEFSEPGVYTAASFDKVVEGFPRKQGTMLKGSVIISRVPVVLTGDTLRISSGEAINYLPKANLPETSFSWTSSVQSGSVRGNTKKGSGAIQDVIRNEGSIPACLVYSITPFRSENGNICTGESRNLIILISPIK